MKSYIKLLAIAAIVAFSTSLSAQETQLDTKLPETWQANLDHANFRKPMNVRPSRGQYAPAALTNGRKYNAVTTKTTHSNSQTAATINNNSGNSYYRSYGVDDQASQNVSYNSHIQIKQGATINAAERTPFEDVIATTGQMRVKREDTPNDPAPVGGMALPLILMAGIYVAIRLKK